MAQKHHWDLKNCLDNQIKLPAITNPNRQKWVHYFFNQFKAKVQDQLVHLRQAVIHSDANDWNVLCENGKISGIIDFGDMCFSPLINELAIALAYIMMNKNDPIKTACQVISSYHSVLPLEKKELQLLYYLIAGRLCVSLVNSAYNRQVQPENDYISVSEEGAWALLEKWLRIAPQKAENAFLKAAGFTIN